MKHGKFLSFLSGVVFPDNVKFFADNNKIIFTVCSKSRYKKKTFCQVEYRGEDAPQIFSKMDRREIFVMLHGEMVNHTRSNELMMICDDVTILGEHTRDGIMDIHTNNVDNGGNGNE